LHETSNDGCSGRQQVWKARTYITIDGRFTKYLFRELFYKNNLSVFFLFPNKIESSSKKVLEILTCILSNSPSALEVCLLRGRCFQGNGHLIFEALD